MTTTDTMDSAAARIDALIGRHIAKKERLLRLQARIDRMIDYRTKAIRALGKQKAVTLTLRLPGI